MRPKLHFCFVALACLCCSAWGSSQQKACRQTAMTQMELNRCAREAAAKADAEKSATYSTLIAKISKNKGALTKVRAAEEAWVLYRDAYISAMFSAEDKQAEYGSMFPMEVDELRSKLAEEHTMALRNLLRQYDPSNVR